MKRFITFTMAVLLGLVSSQSPSNQIDFETNSNKCSAVICFIKAWQFLFSFFALKQTRLFFKSFMVKIAINGLGRIGRCVLRAVFEENIQEIEVVAVNGPAEIEQHVHLLQYDSTHGRFPFPITHDGSNIINRRRISIPLFWSHCQFCFQAILSLRPSATWPTHPRFCSDPRFQKIHTKVRGHTLVTPYSASCALALSSNMAVAATGFN